MAASIYQQEQQYAYSYQRYKQLSQNTKIYSFDSKRSDPFQLGFIQKSMELGRAFLKLQSQEFICRSRCTLQMLSSKKIYANVLNQVLQQLQSFWQRAQSLSEEWVVVEGNRLVSKFLEMSISHRVKKPDWRHVYCKHVSVLSLHKNKALVLYYFKIACQLSKEISIAHLSHLLHKKQKIQLIINSHELKINYFKYLNDLKNFSFIQKISIKICRYMASLTIQQDSIQDLFKHYLLALVSNLQTSLKHKIRPIILAAFDSYIVYCIKHQATMNELKLNVFSLIDNLISLYSINPSDYGNLYTFLSNFMILIRTQPVRKFVGQFSLVCRIPQITQKIIKFIESLQEITDFLSRDLIQKLYLSILFAKQSKQYFIDLTQSYLNQNYQSKKLCCIISLLAFQAQIIKFKTDNNLEEFKQQIEVFMMTLRSLQKYFSQQELQKIIGIYLVDLNNILRQHLYPLIQTLNIYKILQISRSHKQSLVEWAPICQSFLKILELINNQEKYEQIILAHQEYSVYISICRYLIQNDELSLMQLLRILASRQSMIFNGAGSSLALFRVLISINKLCLSQYCRPYFQAFFKIISNFDLRYFVQNSKCYLIFNSFRQLQNPFYQKISRYQAIFSANLLQTQIKAVLKAYRSLSTSEMEDNEGNWENIVSVLISSIGEHYDYLEEEAVEEIILSMINLKTSKNSPNILKLIKNVVSRQIFTLIRHQESINISQLKNIITNYLSIYKKVLNYKQEILLDEQLDFVDFSFNLKASLYDILQHLKKQGAEILIQQIVEALQVIQLQLLQSTAYEFIHSLNIILQQDEQPNLVLLASAAVKIVYCLIYPNCFSFDKDHYKQLTMSTDSEEAPLISNKEFLFLQEQLQNSSTLLCMIKTKCKKLQAIFRRLCCLDHSETIAQQIVIFEQMTLKADEAQPLRIHLLDLIYLTDLCGLNSFKALILSLYLTLIKRYNGIQIYLFQISRFISLELFNPKKADSMKSFLQRQIRKNSSCINSHFIGVISLLLTGEISQELYESKRIYRLLYYLNNDPLAIVNDYKTIVWYICSYVFTFFSQPFQDVQRQKSLMKMSKQLKCLSKTQWTSDIWQQDCSYLRLLVLFFKKLFKKVLQLNELSKIRSILPFAVLTLIKSGHFDQLALPIKIMMLKKKDVDFLHIADNLMKLVSDEINPSEYKKIDRILCGKRKSLSMGLNIGGFARVVDKTFERAGKIGAVLGQIFMMIIFEMLGANQWQRYKCRKKMSIFQQRSNQVSILDKLLESQDLSIVEEMNKVRDLTEGLPQIVFKDYGLGLVLKDYISQFLDQAMQHSDTLSVYQNIQIDNLIVKITVCFQEYNYTLKSFWSKHTQPLSLSDNSYTHIKIIQQLLQDHKKIALEYPRNIQRKIDQLQSVNYPLNIVFPIGNFVYNVACKDTLLVTFLKRVYFEDKISVCQDIIRINNQILSQGDMKLPINHRKRKGLDSQLGKIILSTDFGIADFDAKSISPSNLLNEILSIHPSLAKFLQDNQHDVSHHLQHFVKRYKLGDFQAIKTKIKKVAQKIDQGLKLKQGRENILLYIYGKYLSFSFEGIQSISSYKAAYRIPSLEYLIQHQDKERVFNIDLCKYLINTKNNLPQTEKKFDMIKKKFPSWVGIIGRVPPAEEIVTLLNRDLFLYMGHGTGFEHIPPSEYIKFGPACVMLVYGCSSCLMTYDRSQPFGCTFDFLMRGCPAYLGCLWNVTDVDLDRITAQMLLQQGQDNLSSILNKSKLNCYFPHLNGAAVVVYGLPSIIVRK